VTGSLDDCACDVEAIDAFNNERPLPKLQKLLKSVNLNKPCSFWTDKSLCGHRNCAVILCTPYLAEVNNHDSEKAEKLGVVDSSSVRRPGSPSWNRTSTMTRQSASVLDEDEESPDSQYVDLLLNPEHFTGYKGPEAWQIWNSTYEENCLKQLVPEEQRFDVQLTNGESPKRLRDLYFLYLMEQRALAKFCLSSSCTLASPPRNQRHKLLLLELFQVAKSFPLHFDETSLFAGNMEEAATLKEDFRLTFCNISRIMGCMGCVKCRLWGKLQVSEQESSLYSVSRLKSSSGQPIFQLSRQEILSLIIAFG
ncbi:unnamed protein product, partial [Coregonus sp. 'balchen']